MDWGVGLPILVHALNQRSTLRLLFLKSEASYLGGLTPSTSAKYFSTAVTLELAIVSTRFLKLRQPRKSDANA